MALENQKKDIGRYRTIALAPGLIEQKDMGALEQVLISFQEGIGVEINEDTSDATKIIMSNPKTLQDYLQNFMGKYQRELNNSTLRNLRLEYSDLFEKFYTKENLSKVNKLFDSDMTYEKITEKYKFLKERADSDTDNFSDEQKKKAKVEVEELNKIMYPLQSFESLRIKSLGEPIDESSLKKKLNSMYEEKSEKSGYKTA